jgi:uncharacterized protein
MQTVLSTLLLALPFWAIITLANLAETRPGVLHKLTYGLLTLILLAALGFAGIFLLLPLVAGNIPPETQGAALIQNTDWGLVGGALGLGSFLGLLMLLPPVRRLMSRITPVNPNSIVHAIALSLAMFAIGGGIAQGPLAVSALTDLPEEARAQVSQGAWSVLASNLILFVPTALLGIGVLLRRRSWPEIAERFSLKLPQPRDWILLPVGVAVLVAAAQGTLFAWRQLDPGSMDQVSELSRLLLGGLAESGIIGAIAIGVVAGFSEELLFRGAIQPKLGLLLSSIVFTFLHSQYLLSPVTLLVFVISMVLGVIRNRTGSVPLCMAIHALYNFTVSMIG